MEVFDAYEQEFNLVLKDRNFVAADELLKDMSMELRSLAAGDAQLRQSLLQRLTICKEALVKLRRENESGLLLQGSQQTQSELGLQGKISRQNAVIESTMRSVMESEAVGQDIMAELGQNREKIASAIGKVGELKGEIDAAVKKVKSIENRDKCLLS